MCLEMNPKLAQTATGEDAALMGAFEGFSGMYLHMLLKDESFSEAGATSRT